MMAQYVCWSSAGAYVESDGWVRSPVRPEGSAGRLEPANDKPPTYWLSAHGRPSLSSRSRRAAVVDSAWRLNPLWPARRVTSGPVSQSHGVGGGCEPMLSLLGVEPRWSRVESPCRQRSASRFNEDRGKFWLEVFVCNHVTFPKRQRQRRQQIASDFSSRCLEMVLMLWIMSAGEHAVRTSDRDDSWVKLGRMCF